MILNKINVDIFGTIIMLNELRFENKEYLKQNGWYDRNMVNEVTDEEITKAIQDLPSDEIKELTKEFAYKIIDIVKKSTDWYRYRNEDGLFDNR